MIVPQQTNSDMAATSPRDIPYDSPLRKHEKRGLPPTLASTYPHGHISGHPRSPTQQRAFESRKSTILHTMSASQIENAYQDNVRKVLDILEEDKKKNEEIDRQVEMKNKQREMERKLYWRMKEEQGKKSRKKMEDANSKEETTKVKEEGEA